MKPIHVLFIFVLCFALFVSPAEAKNIRSIQVYPANVVMKAGTSVQFTVVAYTINGSAYTPSGVRWYCHGGNISNGMFTAGGSAGTYTITAQFGHYKANAQVTIKSFAPQIAKIIVTPGQAQLQVGQTQRFQATAYDRYNRPVPFTPMWGVGGLRGGIDATGLFRATQPGRFVVTARAQGLQVSGNAVVNVIKYVIPSLGRINIYPAIKKIRIGQTCRFTVSAFNQYNQPVSFQPVWEVSGGGTIDFQGNFRATAPGTYNVIVRDRRTRKSAVARITVVGGYVPNPYPQPQPQPQPQPDPGHGHGGNGRIVIIEYKTGKHFLTPRLTFKFEVYGRRAQTAKIFAYNSKNVAKELAARSVQNGKTVYIKTKYNRFGTTRFEIHLYDNRGNLIARESRAVKSNF